MLGVYLSGTGNTKHCIEKLVGLLDISAKVLPLESEGVVDEIKKHDTIVLGYPTQFSNAPYMVRDFIVSHADLWRGKQILCVTTMGAFSGDGAGCTARLLKKRGAVILGGLHIRMPDSVCDSRLLKKTAEQNKRIVIDADKKIERAALAIQKGQYPQAGIHFPAHIIGLLGQRLWFYRKTSHYSDQLKISDNCIGCGLCRQICPMKNITIHNRKATAGNKCTMCYRCISQCPQKAITLLGNTVWEQCQFSRYTG